MRLKDADVIEKFLDDFADSCGNHQKAVLREVKYALGQMPTIEAVPTDFHDKCQQIEIQKRFKLEEAYRSMERTVEKLTEALAEAEPIRHGNWKKIKSGFDECSVCKYHGSSAFKHCPNCGAKMDLKDHYCDRNKCLQMEYNGKGCAECESDTYSTGHNERDTEVTE